MILYWYMHWFWITTMLYVLLVSSSDIISSTIQSISEESTSEKEMHFENSPPIYATKHKSLKKHFSMASKTIGNSTTVGDEPVIQDSSHRNISEQQRSLFSGILNAFNRSSFNDSLTYFEEEYLNKTFNSNYEQPASNSSLPDNLSAAGITGITLGCVSIVGIVSALSYIVYRNRSFNRPQVLNDHCSNYDSSGYIDDTSDNSEEMYSLDNDSFLNSLEAMTIQNYWTDTVKHTKL